MDQEKINQVLAIVNAGLAGVEGVAVFSTVNEWGTYLNFVSEIGNGIIEDLLAQCADAGLYFNTSNKKTGWLLDAFFDSPAPFLL
jgi:hypothetical protein